MIASAATFFTSFFKLVKKLEPKPTAAKDTVEKKSGFPILFLQRQEEGKLK